VRVPLPSPIEWRKAYLECPAQRIGVLVRLKVLQTTGIRRTRATWGVEAREQRRDCEAPGELVVPGVE
jgi:hypothetical protein